MFEEKIKLTPIEIDNVVEKEIYGQKVKFNKYLEQDYCKIIIDICIESFINTKDKDFSTSLMNTMQNMNIALCYLTTNINIDNISYEDLCAMGVFKTIKETLINYNEIKNIIMLSISVIFDNFIYKTLEQLPTTKGMAENLSEIKEIITSNPEKAQEYANIVIANHPELKGFGEIFENIINKINKKE